jgi:hypothetical protein
MIAVAIFLVVAPILLAVPFMLLMGLVAVHPFWVLLALVIWGVSYPIYHKVQYGHWPGG